MRALFRILRNLLLGWFPALIALCRGLIALLCRRPRRISASNRDQAGNAGPCAPLNSPVLVHPDPMIYDQYYLARLGLAVTWDNPDIQLFHQGTPVSSSELTPATEYQVVARIWNGANDAPVAALPVEFSYLSFGVGAASHPIGWTTVDLGVKGGPNHPAFAVHSWTTPATPGHYCIQALLHPFDDANWDNNLGQENTQVGYAHSPANFTFTLRNDGAVRRSYTFDVDAYHLTPPAPCPPPARNQRRRKDASPGTIPVPSAHKKGQHALPEGWRVSLDPAQPDLDGGEEITVQVTVDPPPDFTGEQNVNINAFSQGVLAGGVTLVVAVAR